MEIGRSYRRTARPLKSPSTSPSFIACFSLISLSLITQLSKNRNYRRCGARFNALVLPILPCLNRDQSRARSFRQNARHCFDSVSLHLLVRELVLKDRISFIWSILLYSFILGHVCKLMSLQTTRSFPTNIIYWTNLFLDLIRCIPYCTNSCRNANHYCKCLLVFNEQRIGHE